MEKSDGNIRRAASEYQAGLGTTPAMWEMLSDLLEGEKLPESLNAAIYALRDGKAEVVPK